MKTASVCFLAIASLAATGCWQKGTGHYQVYVDNSFVQDRKDQIQEALNDWSTVTDGVVTFTPTGTFDQDVEDKITILSTSIQNLTVNYGDPDSFHIITGWTTYHGTSSVIEVGVNASPNEFHRTIRHELGHAIGLSHTGSGTLMSPSRDTVTKDITCIDRQQFCDTWECETDSNCVIQHR